MRTYDLYEIKVASIFEARRLIESTLSIILEEHESSFHRGPYFRAELAGDENIQLKLNLDPFEDVPHQDDYPDAAILLYVNNTNRSSELRNTLAELGDFINLLRHQEI